MPYSYYERLGQELKILKRIKHLVRKLFIGLWSFEVMTRKWKKEKAAYDDEKSFWKVRIPITE